jgi:hypothetical protein
VRGLPDIFEAFMQDTPFAFTKSCIPTEIPRVVPLRTQAGWPGWAVIVRSQMPYVASTIGRENLREIVRNGADAVLKGGFT